MEVKKMKLNPDTITIYGDYGVIQIIDSIKTKKITFNNLSKTKNGVVDLEQLPGIRFSQNEVYYSLEVERYVEKSISLPVEVRDSPSDKIVTFFPQVVKLIYRIPFKYINNTEETENLKIIIDYKDIINSVNYFVEPSLERVPDDFLSFDFDPKFIECRVVENKIK
jgi:YbbR domain-containing protein